MKKVGTMTRMLQPESHGTKLKCSLHKYQQKKNAAYI